MPSHVSRRSWAGLRWEEFDPWYYEKNGELAGGFKDILRKLTWNLKISKSWKRMEKEKHLQNNCCFVFYVNFPGCLFYFHLQKFGAIFQFHDVFYKWVESQPPIIVEILLEIRMRFLAPLFFKGPSTKVFKNSKEENKKDTINWTWNKGEDFRIKMDVSHGNIYVEMRSKIQGL